MPTRAACHRNFRSTESKAENFPSNDSVTSDAPRLATSAQLHRVSFFEPETYHRTEIIRNAERITHHPDCVKRTAQPHQRQQGVRDNDKIRIVDRESELELWTRLKRIAS